MTPRRTITADAVMPAGSTIASRRITITLGAEPWDATEHLAAAATDRRSPLGPPIRRRCVTDGCGNPVHHDGRVRCNDCIVNNKLTHRLARAPE